MIASQAILDDTDEVDDPAIAGRFSTALIPTESASNVSAKRGDTIQDLSGAAYLYGSVSGWLGNAQHDIQGFKAYLEKLIQDAKTTDVIERMLVEELVWAHHNVGRLLVRASVAKDADEQKVLNTGAVRLMGEFRRCALAVQSYRAAATKAKMVVKGYLPISAAFPSLQTEKGST
jgi:hypothetical protein